MHGVQITRRGLFRVGSGLAAGLVLAPGSAPTAPAAGPPAPFIENCPSWGARRPSSPVKIWDRRPVRILVHHTAGPNRPDVSREAGRRMARSIQAYHMDHNGWLDSGQHFTISRGGFVLEGRFLSLGELNGGRRQVEGAHCTGQNVVAVGIENEGTYIGDGPPLALWNSLRSLCAYICFRYGIAPTELYGHRDYKNTICPGDRLYSMLPRLRAEVAGVLGRRLSLTEVTKAAWPLLRTGDSGPEVSAAQWLLRDAGATRGSATGRFDAATAEAVREFQSATGAENVNGILGGESWPVLARTVSREASLLRGTGRFQGDAGKAVETLAARRPIESVPDTVETADWQRLLGTGGAPVRRVSDPPGVANR